VNAPVRYTIPGDVMLPMIGSLSEAFDGLATAALALQNDDVTSAAVALQHIHSRLSTLHEAFFAIVGEHAAHEENKHGSARHH
jgi:hypothetical protein